MLRLYRIQPQSQGQTDQATIWDLLLPITLHCSQELMFGLNSAQPFPFICSLEAPGAPTTILSHTGVNSPLLVKPVDSSILVVAIALQPPPQQHHSRLHCPSLQHGKNVFPLSKSRSVLKTAHSPHTSL